MKPEITILGSGTCVPRTERSSCSVLVKTGASLILLDMGPGTMRRLLRTGKNIDSLTHICLSHFHPDHSAELVPFLFASKYGGSSRRKPIRLLAGPGFASFFTALQEAYGHWIDLGKNLCRLEELNSTGPPFCTPDFTLTAGPAVHRPESIALGIETPHGFKMVYSGDTDYCQGLIDFARGADLLICEASTPEGHKIEGHLTPALAGAIGAAARVGKLVLTHFYPVCDSVDIAKQCRTTYKGPLVIAADLMKI